MNTFKNAEQIQVGDVVLYSAFGGERRTVQITHTSQDIKNGRAGFDGVEVNSGAQVWGYCDQIVKYISHA